MYKILRMMVITLSLGACAGVPQISEQPVSADEVKGFYQVLNLQQLSTVYIRSAVALQGYRQVVFSELDVSRLEIDKSRLQPRQDYWRLEDSDTRRLREMYRDQLARFYDGNSRTLTRVKKPGGGVLQVDFALTRYTPNAPKDDARGRSAGQTFYAESAGLLAMQVRISDSDTGELLAVVEDDRELGTEWEEDNRVNNARRLRQGLLVWIKRIDTAIGQLQG